MSFQEVLGATSAITTSGVQTSVAMTQLKAVFANLAKPTESLSAALRKAGIESVEASLKSEGLVGTLKKIQSTTGGTVTELQALFGSVEAGSAVVALTSDTIGGKFNAIMADMAKASQNAGQTTQEAFDKIAATTSFKMKQVDGAIKAFGTEIGNTLMPAFNAVLDGISLMLTAANDFFQENRESILSFAMEVGDAIKSAIVFIVEFGTVIKENSQIIISIGAGITAAIVAYGGYSAAVAIATGATGFFTTALTAAKAALVFLTGPIGLTITAIGLLVAGVVYAYQNFDVLSAFVLDVAQDILKALIPAINFLIDSFTFLEQAFNVGVSGIKLYYASLLDIALAIADYMLPAFDTLLGAIGSVAGVFDEDLKQSIDGARNTIVSFKDSLQEKVNAVKQDSTEMIKNAGVTDESRKRNEALKAGYSGLISEVENMADKSKVLINEQENTASATKKVEVEAKKESVAVKDLTKNVEATASATKVASKESEAYAKQLEKLRSEIENIQFKAENLDKQYKIIDTDSELKAIADIEGRQKVATILVEAERLKSIGKVKEAELALEKLKAESAINGINQAQKAREDARKKELQDEEKFNEFLEKQRLESVQKENEKKIRLSKAAADKELENEDAIDKKREENAQKFYAGLKEAGETFVEVVQAGFDASVAFFKTGLDIAGGSLIDSVKEALESVTSLPKSLAASADGLVAAIDEGLTLDSMTDTMIESVDKMIDKLINDAPKLVNSIIKNLPRLFTALAKALPTLIKTVTKAIPQIVPPLVKGFVKAFKAILPEIPALIRAIVSQLPVILDGLLQVIPLIIRELPKIISALLQYIAPLINTIVENLPAIIQAIVDATPEIIQAVVDNLPAIIQALIEAIPVIVVELIKATPQIALALAEGIINLIPAILDGFFPGFGSGVSEIFGKIITAFKNVFTWIYDNLLKPFVDFLSATFTFIWEKILQPWVNLVKAIFLFIYDYIFIPVITFFQEMFQWVYDTIFMPVISFFREAFQWISDEVLKPAAQLFKQGFEWFRDNVVTPLKNAFDWLKSNVVDPLIAAIDSLLDLPNKLGDAIGSIGDSVGGFFNDPLGTIGGWFADGGIVGGRKVSTPDSKQYDNVHAMLSKGELVVPKSAVNQGLGGILSFAKDQGISSQKMASGGIVGGTPTIVPTRIDNSLGLSSLSTEMRQLRTELKAMGTSIAVNTSKIEKILYTWEGGGLPSDRGF